MNMYTVKQIGTIRCDSDDYRIIVNKDFQPALEGLYGFSHLNILWWFSECDNVNARSTLQERSPYQSGPENLGTFATRSPMRPNPLALSCVEVIYIDNDAGVIGITYTDANDGSPLLDIKPYTPSLDKVESPKTPDWCAHWPKNVEASGAFDWSKVFNFE